MDDIINSLSGAALGAWYSLIFYIGKDYDYPWIIFFAVILSIQLIFLFFTWAEIIRQWKSLNVQEMLIKEKLKKFCIYLGGFILFNVLFFIYFCFSFNALYLLPIPIGIIFSNTFTIFYTGALSKKIF
jgi:drug/metabolite transporter (DMT)-like permease